MLKIKKKKNHEVRNVFCYQFFYTYNEKKTIKRLEFNENTVTFSIYTHHLIIEIN